jgi:hypothetical protein
LQIAGAIAAVKEVYTMTSSPNLTEEQRYQLYWDERKVLIDALREGARTFDKAILTFTSGAFAVSIAFVKNIVPSPFPNTLWLLGWSWLLFALSLVVILFSFVAGDNACRAQMDVAYEAIVNNRKTSNPWATATAACNYLSLALLAAAFVFSGCFVYWNLLHIK